MKKLIIIVVSLVVIVGLCVGGIWYYISNKDAKVEVEVMQVSNLAWQGMGDEMRSYGMVTNDMSQQVHVTENQTVMEVFVTEGQAVEIGDPLLSFDITLLQLQLEMKELEIQGIRNDLILEQKQLEKLKNTQPISETPVLPPTPDPIPEPTPEPTPEPIPEPPAQTVYQGDSNLFSVIGVQGELQIPNPGNLVFGTIDNPYVFRCTPDAYFSGEFMTGLAEAGAYVSFVIVNEGQENPTLLSKIAAKVFVATKGGMLEPNSKWRVGDGSYVEPPVEEPPVEEPPVEEPPVIEPPIVEPPIIEQPVGYTQKELTEQIEKVERKIKNLDLNIRVAELALQNMKNTTDNGTVLSTIKGIVKKVLDKDNLPKDGSPLIEVSGSEGLYITGAISELLLDKVKIGQLMNASSWESGNIFEATITEISMYPSDSNSYSGEGNSNVSYYPFSAYVADSNGLRNGEAVDLSFTVASETTGQGMYIEKAYVRSEDGKSYVMIADENDRLKKKYIQTGKTMYGTSIEVKSGLTMEDRIAFPYGKTVKEGIKVKSQDDSTTMYR